jgi:nucleotide-binding universal stress UspA family protein
MFNPKNILVPTDFSPYAYYAFVVALSIAQKYNAKVRLLHVIDIHVQQCNFEYCIPEKQFNDYKNLMVNNTKEMLHKQVETSGLQERLTITEDVQIGVPYEKILETEKEQRIDLIVLGKHGKTGLLSHLIGSVSEKVARKATCHVLLVRKPD